MAYRILSLDGGGVRGVISVVWLQKLAERHPDFLNNVDLFAGTSMGAANAAALATGVSFDKILGIYQNAGPTLFRQRLQPAAPLGWITSGLSHVPGFSWVDTLVRLFLPKWDNAGLHRELASVFGTSATLGSLSKRVMFTTMDLSEQLPGYDVATVKPRLMHNYPNSDFADTTLQDALMRSMAAPTFFPSYQGYVDGGLLAVNPSPAAIGLTRDRRYGNREFEEIRLLSIGAGIGADGIANNGRLMWGLLRWGESFADASTTAVAEFDADLAAALLGENRCRLNAPLSSSVPMDDYAAVDKLIHFAESQIDTPAFAAAERFVSDHFTAA
jgi:patatin-like phospholipase/acyl hydrolase